MAGFWIAFALMLVVCGSAVWDDVSRTRESKSFTARANQAIDLTGGRR
ncbi:MAG: hypothetical protein JWM40_377 [Frankiales bacterium]|nr:hypothetical protein [Frankiales bacterium]